MTGTPLTDLQQHLLRELVKGKRLNEIARERGITVRTITSHAKNLREKCGVRTPFQLGAWAERHGYGEPKMVDVPEARR